MRPCERRDAYLNGALSRKDAAMFQRHLTECAECRDRIDEWRTFETGVRRWAETRKPSPVSMDDVQTLVRRAETGRHAKRTRMFPAPVLRWGGVAVVASAAVVMLVMLALSRVTPRLDGEAPKESLAPQLAVVTGLASTPVRFEKGARLEAPEAHPVQATIGKDKVAVSSKSRVRLLDLDRRRVRLGLESGTVACHVDKRKGTESFVVEAGRYMVRVVGTRFSVTRDQDGLEVLVQEGAVRVERGPGASWMLRGGEVLSDTANGDPVVSAAAPDTVAEMNALFETPALSAVGPDEQRKPRAAPAVDGLEDEAFFDTEIELTETTETVSKAELNSRPRREKTTPVPDLPAWRRWVVDGQTETAVSAMQHYLRAKPDDHRVWALLGDALRKERDWDGAVDAYRHAIASGRGAEASRSMYMLAALLQSPLGRHREALEMFRAYKKSAHVSSKLSELTDVKIARSLVALGQCDAAQKSVAHLLQSEGSIVAKNAKKMVETCRRRSENDGAPPPLDDE